MVITYHGAQCFKISVGDTAIVFNPISKKTKTKLTPVKFGVDMALVSLNHPDFNGIEQISNKDAFIVRGPGEYEEGQISVHGFGVQTIYEGEEKFNTIYAIRFDNFNIVFLGAISNPEIDSKILGELGDIDILFLPIGGGDVLEVPEAAKLAVKLEAKTIIPTLFDQSSVMAFTKEMGAEKVERLEKLTIKRKDLVDNNGKVIFFSL